MTRAELIVQAQKWAEGEDSDRWSDDEIALYADLVFRQEWAGILRLNPDYRTSTRTVTPSAAGVFARSDLNSGSGDSLERLYRIRWLKVGDVPYEMLDIHERPVDTTATYYGWYRDGDNIQLLPASSTPAVVKVTHLPQKPSALSAADVGITFPEDYEQILALETAALMLAKGGTETDEAQQLRSIAAAIRDRMHEEIARDSSRPLGFAYDDTPETWGGQ